MVNINTNDNAGLSEHVLVKTKYNGQLYLCELSEEQCRKQLEILYKKGIITENQYTEQHNKLTHIPSDINERLSYIKKISDNLNKIYATSNHEIGDI